MLNKIKKIILQLENERERERERERKRLKSYSILDFLLIK